MARGTTVRTIGNGRKVVAAAATAERLVAAETQVQAVVITAETDNSGTICVGTSTVVALLGTTRTGTPLAPGQALTIDIGDSQIDLNDLWLDATVTGDGVTFTYFV